jgi:SNF2 family DNA or RNA helicase
LPSSTIQYIPCEITDKQVLSFLDVCSKKIDYNSSTLPSFTEFSTVRSVLAQSKLEAALDIVEQNEYNEMPTIVFSAHINPLIEIGKREGWAVITGDTTEEQRNYIVTNQANYKGIALSLACADVGLTLTSFHNILFIDLSYDTTINNQAISRCVRIGQTKHTNVKVLLADHKIEHHVIKLLAKADMNIAIMIDGLRF